MKTARKLGIPTVAVYSDADATAVHTRFADEAVNIGPAPSAQSYLDHKKILENAAFAEEVAAAGFTFVGPPAHAVHAMGDKVESKRFAHEAGVNTIPGWAGVVEGPDHAVALAADIGYPVMIKASAGGGGKGMRIAWSERDLREGYALASQEAAASFGDDRMLIEKFIEEPRHIEIQVMGDKEGHVVFFPERECSIQRRNQKVIEEAPSPFVPRELRRRMGEQAVALCKAVGYHSAGTCEFLVDKHRNFYFLEMNTRLQVEHPVTEAVTRQDLVELMLRVAAGEPLRLTQEEADVAHGWAIEARVYAEDPARGFLPSTGRLRRYVPPRGEGVRVDTGVQEGSEISMFYDPMICKLITHADDRAGALARMRGALDSYVVRGVQHNIPLLRSVLDVPDFVAGTFSTAFLKEHYPTPEASAPAEQPGRELRFEVDLDGRTVAVALDEAPRETASVLAVAGFDGQDPVAAQVLENGPRTVTLQLAGAQRSVAVDPAAAGDLARHMPEPVVEDFSKTVRSPMPGTLISVAVQPGDKVKPGDDVAVVEAMKMRNVLHAEVEGVVASVEVKPGSTVAADEVIVFFE
ncbi:hypothetical protein QBZ16_002195 [Prototheca wickerhamii]|uniref:Propionyl-CoA carboxylase alpha chain, mitochondrial n=1 Tax=Prototheca wickerhamii TaxID=3111 RepID=A0AAD9MLJ1_PROWI|nr:hypothetical protein QBZ16_002195 [Prototheca wickerhamii]